MNNRQSNDRFDGQFHQLIHDARLGDQTATGKLVSEYRDYLLLIANEEFDRGLQAKMGPSDVVQQSLLAAQEHVAGFRGESEAEFRGWLRQILKNDMLDAKRKYRTSQRRQIGLEKQIDDSQQVQPRLVDQLNTPQTDALSRERGELLAQAMKQLNSQAQRVLQLRHWKEMSFVEIGSQLGCSADAARKSWYRAVVQLEKIILKENPGLVSNSSLELPPQDD